MAVAQVLDQPGVGRLPIKPPAGQFAGRGVVERDEIAEEREVLTGVLGRDARGGRCSLRPIASATSRNGTPLSATACSRVPAAPCSSARRCRCAASRAWTEGQRLDPSPTQPLLPPGRRAPDPRRDRGPARDAGEHVRRDSRADWTGGEDRRHEWVDFFVPGRCEAAGGCHAGPSPERRRAASLRADPAPGARARPLMRQSSGRTAIIPG